MNNKLILLLVASLLVSVSIAADTKEVECKNHPGFGKARKMISDIIANDSKGQEKGKALLDMFENADPAKQTADDLGVCKQFADQNSCCTKNLTRLLEKAALLKIKPVLKAKTAFNKLIAVYVSKSTSNNCPARKAGKTLSVDAIMADASLDKLVTQKNNHKQCKIEFGQAMAKLTRGAMCSICAGVDKLSDYFESNGQIKVSQASADQYKAAVDKAINCISESISEVNIGAIADQIKTVYDQDAACADTVKTAVLAVRAKAEVKTSDGSTRKCDVKKIFSPSVACENSIGGKDGFESRRLLREETEHMYRILEDDASTVSSGGVNVYVESSLDANTDENGDFSLDFEDVDDSNNAFKLGFGAFMVLLAFLL